MEYREVPSGIIIAVKVKAGSSSFRLHQNGTLEVKSLPERNKANAEIARELSDIFSCEAVIVKGAKSTRKEILLKGIGSERLNRIPYK